jgi:hypothetical protein
LQAAIAWIMTRDSELTFSLAETELDKIEDLILRAGLTSNMQAEKAWLKLRGAVSDGRIAIWDKHSNSPRTSNLAMSGLVVRSGN